MMGSTDVVPLGANVRAVIHRIGTLDGRQVRCVTRRFTVAIPPISTGYARVAFQSYTQFIITASRRLITTASYIYIQRKMLFKFTLS